ncbi:tRNA-splicing endonuclease subunit Sen34 isoform X2 [Achroia grisella]|uniref:tRNA-splicing endonuclease subunit Sen34 isoform X2 n=1 Tax=Achroia grisella TaxID=688607 RepID=UPI0027D301B4|nr:tRNA-splicing endonuclease subunit Sen34 isoform X2 [Achroia grisella]
MVISLNVHDGVAYVWNSDGLPMALMSEEAALLVEKGICELFELPTITDKLTNTEVEEIKIEEQRVLQEQKEALMKRKAEQMSQKIDIIMAGKRQKLLSKGVTDINLDKHSVLQEEINKLPPLNPAHVLVHLPTKHHIDIEKQQVGVDALRPNLKDNAAARYTIFKDLWEKGYHITNGPKFGSDFLVYPGDPVKFHAMYMVRCVSDQTTSLCPSSLVAYGRLSVAVNKLAILAFCSNYNKVDYQTLQWHDSIHR